MLANPGASPPAHRSESTQHPESRVPAHKSLRPSYKKQESRLPRLWDHEELGNPGTGAWGSSFSEAEGSMAAREAVLNLRGRGN